MKKLKSVIAILLAASLMLCAVPIATAETAETEENGMPELKEYGFINCNGVQIEYGIYGDMNAEPLLLLPPNGGNMHSFDGNVLPEMAKHFKVITVSPRGTGNSERGEGALTFDVMSDDLVCILDYLGVEKTNIFGFSDGGNLGLVFTVAHPERVKALGIMGANINPCGTKTFTQIGIVFEWVWYAVKAAFTRDPADKIKRDIQGLMVFHPQLTFKDLETIEVPVLNIYGEDDMMKRCHSKRITKSIPNAKEIMIVGGGHSSCFKYTDTIINPALLELFGVTEA